MNWERIKQEERAHKKSTRSARRRAGGATGIVARAKLQKRAARVGFDWEDWRDVLAKMEEEKAELLAAIATTIAQHIDDEIGDSIVLLRQSCALSRCRSRTALRATNRKFERVSATSNERWRRRGATARGQSCGNGSALDRGQARERRARRRGNRLTRE